MKGVAPAFLAFAMVAASAALGQPVVTGQAHSPGVTTPGDPDLQGLPSDPVLALAAVDRRIADLNTGEQSDRNELVRLGEQLAHQHEHVLLRGRAFYRLSRTGLLPVGGGFRALVSHAMHVERARRMLAADIGTESRLRGRAADVAHDLERIAGDRVRLTTQRSALDAARSAKQDEDRRQNAFDRAFQKSTGASSALVPVYGGALSPDTPAGGFATARGHLLLPVAGRAEINPARREGTEGPGLEIHTPAGVPVRAVFGGRVAFADRYGPYGRIVILDHGDHYFTVSGNLDEIDVQIGQDVAAGDRIGTVGDEGRGTMVYFEIRHGSRAIAPEPWLGF